ncbi:MAG: helix-hairpin-helix domain-containing protein [Anaerolineales bacterium]
MWGRYGQTLYGLLLGLLATGVLLVVARRPPGHPVQLQEPPTPVPLRIHVTGAVASPGVYPLPRGSIIQDAITAAGGPTERADLSHINLAQLLVDGDQVIVPDLPPTATPVPPTPTLAPTITVGPGTPTPTPLPTSTPAPTTPPASAVGGKININTATLAELDTLPRIGPAIAQRIIDYRTANGPFRSIEEIMEVSGIGPAIFEQIKDLITVN